MVETITGIVQYKTGAAFLNEGVGLLSLLAIDVPPMGAFNPQDVGAAYSYLRNILHVPSGGSIAVEGIRTQISNQLIIGIIRFV